MKLSTIKHLLALGCISLSLVAPVWANQEKIPVRGSILVDKPQVDASCLLGSEAFPDLRAKLEKISIGVIASPLGEIKFQRADLSRKLGEYSEMFEIPQKVQVFRKGDLIEGKEIAKRVMEMFRDRGDQVKCDLSRLPSHIALPGRLVSWNLKPLSTNPLGMSLFSLEAECEGGKVRQVIQTDVWKVCRIAKMKQLGKIGQVIGPDDVLEETVKVKSESAIPSIAFDQVIGQTLKIYKSAGSVIRADDVTLAEPGHSMLISDGKNAKTSIDGTLLRGEARIPFISSPLPSVTGSSMPRALKSPVGPEVQAAPASRTMISPAAMAGACTKASWVVKPGANVKFSVKSGSLHLTVPAKALEGGCVGDSIKLMNLANNRNIDGIITGEGKVEYAEK